MYYNNPNMPNNNANMPFNMPYEKYEIPEKEYMYDMGMHYPKFMAMGMSQPLFMEKEKSKVCVKVPEVIGRNSTQILLETEIPFAAGCPAMEIKDIVKEVKELILSVCKDKVLINGILHKNINYKTYEASKKVHCNCNEIELAYGDVKHVSVNIPFSGFIDIPGARKGDIVEVEYAGVEDCCELDILKNPYFIRGCKVPVYKKLKEKVIVKIEVKVLRPVQITVGSECPNMCP